MRLFHLNRYVDMSGISGTGIVADGVEFDDGQCVVSWRGRFHSIEVWPNVKGILETHGHNGLTVVEWLEAENERAEIAPVDAVS